MARDEITVTSTTDTPEAVAEALAEGTEPESASSETLEEPTPDETGGDEDEDGEDGEAEEGEASATETDADAPPTKPHRRRGGQKSMQQRIDTLTWQINRERAEREALQAQLEQARNPQQQPQAPQA